MDEDARTLYCGNLSDRVTEDILYELFLQGGPVQKISIPRDRDGKQRTYGFVTYKHIYSVGYALRLFEGTMLYNRLLSMKPRNSTDSQQTERPLDPVCRMNPMQLLQLGQQMILGNYPQVSSPYPSQLNVNSGNDDRKRIHPYQRDRNREKDRLRDRERDREKDRSRDRDGDRGREWERNRERNYNDHYRDERSHYNRDNSYRSNDYSRYNDNRKRWFHH